MNNVERRRWVLNGYSLQTSLCLLGYETHDSRRCLQIQIEAIEATFLINFGASNMSIVFIVKVKILVHFKWSCRFSCNHAPIMLIIEYKIINIINSTLVCAIRLALHKYYLFIHINYLGSKLIDIIFFFSYSSI